MEQAESQPAEVPTRIRGAWLQLTLELGVLVAAGALLARIGFQIPGGRPDLGFVFAVAVFLHATGFLLDPEGVVDIAVYSNGAIGRLTADDSLQILEYRLQSDD